MFNSRFQQLFTLSLLLFTHIFFVPFGLAQELSTGSARAKKFFEQGSRYFTLMYYDNAEKALAKAIAADENFIEAYMLLGDVFKSNGKPLDALEVYQKVIRIDEQKYPEVYFFSGLLYFEVQNYPLSIRRLQKYLSIEPGQTKRTDDAQFYMSCAEFANHATQNLVPFSPINIGKEVNTPNDEYINAVRADGLTMFFTGRQSKAGNLPGGDDFYYSKRTNDTLLWQPSQKLGAPVNTSGDEGALTITPDGRYLLFAGCQWPDGFGSCDIYASKLLGSKPQKPVNMGSKINSAAWESQPSLSSDGRTLFFASARSGGNGNTDLWKSVLQEDGCWSEPQNLGAKINTSGSEMAPFIHLDGQTLYFSSDRHVGMGGIDLFVSRLDSTGNWSDPLNLGFPVNTPGDEINIVVNIGGDKGFISADQLGGFGGFDIFEFDLYDEIKPVPSTFMKGIIIDSVSKKPLEAYFRLIDLESKKEIVRSFSDEKTGEFLVCIPTNRQYALHVSKENYLFYSDNISLTGIKTDVEPYLINIELNLITRGKTIVLRNIFFDSEKFELKDQSLAELEKLVEFLNFNTQLKIEIQGHTDNVGSESFNYTLSENRAMAVFNYLIKNGIDANRLQYKGFGFSQPISENLTETGRALNRRTEIKILEVVR